MILCSVYLGNNVFNFLNILSINLEEVLGIGDWGLGIGDGPQPPIPNPQSPIPNK